MWECTKGGLLPTTPSSVAVYSTAYGSRAMWDNTEGAPLPSVSRQRGSVIGESNCTLLCISVPMYQRISMAHRSPTVGH